MVERFRREGFEDEDEEEEDAGFEVLVVVVEEGVESCEGLRGEETREVERIL